MEKKPEKGWESKSHEKANHMGLSSLAITDFSNCVPSFYNCLFLSLSLSPLSLLGVGVGEGRENKGDEKAEKDVVCLKLMHQKVDLEVGFLS